MSRNCSLRIENNLLVQSVHGREDVDGLDYSFEELTLFQGGFFDHLAEDSSVEFVKFAGGAAGDAGSSRGVVHEGQLSEGLPMFVGLKVGLLLVDELSALELPSLNNEQLLAVLALLNHGLTLSVLLLRHAFDERLLVLPIQVLEEDGVADEGFDQQLGLLAFGDLSEDDRLLFVKGAERLLGDAHPALGLSLQLLLEDLGLELGDVLLLLSLRVRFFLSLMSLGVALEPVLSEGEGVGRPLLDDVVD